MSLIVQRALLLVKTVFTSGLGFDSAVLTSSPSWFLNRSCVACALKVIDLLEGEALPPVSSLTRTRTGFHPGWSWICLSSSISPSTLTSFPFWRKASSEQSIMLPPPCFTVGMVLSEWRVKRRVSAKHSTLFRSQKVLFCSNQIYQRFHHAFVGNPNMILCSHFYFSKNEFLVIAGP